MAKNGILPPCAALLCAALAYPAVLLHAPTDVSLVTCMPQLNIECNHATLAGHSCQHELETAAAYGALGSLDANTGDPQVCGGMDEWLVG